MKASTVFIVSAIVALIFGLAFVLFPQQTTALYDVELTEGGVFIGRLLGAALLTFFVVGWMVRNAAPSPERRAIVLAFTVGDTIGFVVSLLSQLAGTANALGWSTVAVYLILALAFAYLLFAGEERGAASFQA